MNCVVGSEAWYAINSKNLCIALYVLSLPRYREPVGYSYLTLKVFGLVDHREVYESRQAQKGNPYWWVLYDKWISM